MPITVTSLLDNDLGLSFSLPPRSGGEAGAVRSTEPGGGPRHPDRKVPPPQTPPRHSLRSRGEGNQTPRREVTNIARRGFGNPRRGARKTKPRPGDPAGAFLLGGVGGNGGPPSE